MNRQRAARILFVLTLFAVLSASAGWADEPRPRQQQDELKSKPVRPILIINAAGFDRVLGSADGLLKMVDRPQLSLTLRGLLAVSTNGLKGIDRKRPFGLMTVINSGEVPEPVGVVYVPVTSADEFLASLRALEFTVKPGAGVDGGYRVTAGKQAFAVRVRRKYAFLAWTLQSLQRDFGNPAVRFAKLSREFDVSIRFDLESTPAGMKAMVLDYVRAVAEMGLEIRRGETTAEHRLRKAVGMVMLAGFEETVQDGRSLTLGLALPTAKDSSGVRVEARLAAREGSPLARGLNDLRAAGESPQYAAQKSAEFRMAANWKPPASLRPVMDAYAANALGTKDPGSKTDYGKFITGLFSTGISLTAWSRTAAAASQATVAVMAFPSPQSAAGQIGSALGWLRGGGVIRTEAVRAAKPGPLFHRVTIPNGDAASGGAVTVIRNRAWLALGTGNVVALLQRDVDAAAAANAGPRGKPLLGAGELFHVSGRWGAIKSLLRTGVLPAASPRAAATEPFELTVAQKSNTLTVRAVLPASAVREGLSPILRRVAPR